jgi:excisionase family DNA binding protein
MAKISLISWRRREKKFPETEAQRRALARERSTASDRCYGFVEGLDGPTVAPPVEVLELAEDYLIEELDALALLSLGKFPDAAEGNLAASAGACVSMGLTADQRYALDALPALCTDSAANAPHALFQLSQSQKYPGTTLQFSIHPQAVPEMLSLKEVSRQLKVGRRTIMHLIRRRELRCYRIAHRYRFTIEDIKNYLERVAIY